jgi:hypothetical protein
MLKVREGDIRLQLQRFLQFVPVISSREVEGKAAKGSVGFGDDQCNIPAGVRAMGELITIATVMYTVQCMHDLIVPL